MKKTKIITTFTFAATALAACSAAIAITACTPTTGDEEKPKQPVATQKLNTTAAPCEVDLNSIASPFTAKNTSSSPVTINVTAPTSTKVTGFKYKIGSGETWVKEVDITKETTVKIDLPANSSIQFYAYNTTVGTFSNEKEFYNIAFTSSTEDEAGIELGGNIMSLLCTTSTYDTCLSQLDATNSAYCFNGLFAGSDAITSVHDNYLPATTLAASCYANMFNGCKNLQIACSLPATTLTANCYAAMFKGCARLAVAPYLPAIKLDSNCAGCYVSLFDGCTDLTSISLGYVGNFIPKYFQGWTNNVVKQGNLYYNGSDEDRSTSEIPNNFARVKDPNFEKQMKEDPSFPYKEFTFVPVSGRAKFGTTKKLVTWYCPSGTTDTAETIVKDGQITPAAVDEQDKDISYYDGTKTDYPQIDPTTTLDKFSTRPVFSFGFNAVIEKGLTNIYSTTSNITLSLAHSASGFKNNLQYRIANDEKAEWTDVKFPQTLKAKTNYVFRGNVASTSDSDYTNIKITGKNVHIEGNLMSLLADGTSIPTTITQPWAFCRLFLGSTGITTVSDDLLPSNTLTEGCYRGLFSGCTNLTNAPKLPASTLQADCYNSMFYNCKKLSTVDASLLKSTSLADRCYQNMFDSSGISTTITLPASTMKTDCYKYMFQNCKSLGTAPALNATSLASACYMSMFEGCTSLTTPMSNLPATSIPGNAYNAMFKGCTALESTPTFNGQTSIRQAKITLSGSACKEMFMNCSSLTDAKPLPLKSIADATYCCYKMYYGCSSLEIAPCVSFCGGSSSQTPSNSYAYMFANCKKLIIQYESWEKIIAPSDDEIQTKHSGFFFSTCAYTSSDMTTWEHMFDGCTNADSGVPTSPQGWRKVKGHWDAFYSYHRALTGLSMSKTSTTLLAGKSEQLSVTTTPKGAATNLTWTSSDPTSVSVNSSGWITAKVANKTATITVKDTTTGKTAICSVTTKQPTTEVEIVGKEKISKGSTQKYELQEKESGEKVDAKFELDGTYSEAISITEDGELTVGTSATEESVTIIAKVSGSQVASKTISITTPTEIKNCVQLNNADKTNEACVITIENYDGQDIQYSTDDGESWTTWDPKTTTSITLESRESIAFKGNNKGRGGFNTTSSKTSIKLTGGSVYLSGSVMGLYDDGTGETEIPNAGCFRYLFANSTGLMYVISGFLSPSKLKAHCYEYMFSECSKLQSVDGTISAEAIPDYACQYMFYNCSALSNTPEIDAKTIGVKGCMDMFAYCSNIATDVPTMENLTTVGESGCYQMYAFCTNLIRAQDLKATTVGASGYYEMFRGCNALTAAPDMAVTTIGAYACYQMFENCTSMETGPSELKLNEATEGCCKLMFSMCTKLKTPPKITVTNTTGGTQCFCMMFSNCVSLVLSETEGTDFYTCNFTDISSLQVETMFNATKGGIETPEMGHTYKYVIS